MVIITITCNDKISLSWLCIFMHRWLFFSLWHNWINNLSQRMHENWEKNVNIKFTQNLKLDGYRIFISKSVLNISDVIYTKTRWWKTTLFLSTSLSFEGSGSAKVLYQFFKNIKKDIWWVFKTSGVILPLQMKINQDKQNFSFVRTHLSPSKWLRDFFAIHGSLKDGDE